MFRELGGVNIKENKNGEPALIPKLAVGCNLGAEERT